MIDEFIKRDTAYNYLTEYYNHRTDIQHQNLRKALNAIPSEDVVEVRHGKWVFDGYNYRDPYVCNICGACTDYESNFCPNCGADMRGKDDG